MRALDCLLRWARAFYSRTRGGREDRACAGCTPERHRTAVVFTAMHDVAARALGVARVPRTRELAGSTARHAPLYTTCPLHTSVAAYVAKRHGKKGRVRIVFAP